MIEHLVLFKMKAAAPAGAADAMIEGLRSLKTAVPSVVDLTIGYNFSERAQGFGIGLTVRFKDRAGLQEYAAHPQHVDVVTRLIRPHTETVLALDYEF